MALKIPLNPFVGAGHARVSNRGHGPLLRNTVQVTLNSEAYSEELNQGIFKHQGGIKRADKLFEQPVAEVLERFNKAIWL